jgi:RND superfamily putative drug exporter
MAAPMSRLLTIATGPRAKYVAFAVWFLVLAISIGANLPGKYADAENNESTSFLPGDAESTRALTEVERIQQGEQAPIVIVYRREGGLTDADRERIAADTAELNRAREELPDVYRAVQPFATEPQFNEAGDGALVFSNITGDGESSTILDPVADIRERVSDPTGELAVAVTGPAGYAADAIEVFDTLNGTLFLSALTLVVALLILIYRSPIFWMIPVTAVVFAEVATRALGYGLTEFGVTINGQSSAILSVLVLGAGTDYALLLVSRYREELRRHEDKHEAMALAMRTAGPAIVASGLTVMAALLCLTLAEVDGTAGLGPIGAMGIFVAMISMLTLLPAMLVILGRRIFWHPKIFGGTNGIPRYGDLHHEESEGFWRRVGERVARRPRVIGALFASVLVVMALGGLKLDTGLTQGDAYRGTVESVQGQELLAQSFPAGSNAPTDVFVPDRADIETVQAALRDAPGVATVAEEVQQGPNGVLVSVVLEAEPYSEAAFNTIPELRRVVKAAAGDEVLVGGPSAIEYDVRQSASRDTTLIIPIALLVVFVILVALLRALVAPVILIATVILSFAASLGFSIALFDWVFGFAGIDPSMPLYAFVFLVALGVDYNIFLMARVREETMRHGTREGMLRGLAVTGGVITSAGIVLAGTFSVFLLLPLVFLIEIGFIIAFGILLDTFLVRSVLVPALVLDHGPRVWWPSRLAKTDGDPALRRGAEPSAEDRGVPV